MKKMKLHLDEHNVIDFLQKLDSAFCERIQELWLDKKGYESQHHKPEHTHDMMKILAKFSNLKSLNLESIFDNFNNESISSAIKNLKDLHIQFK